jgi:hypothetical protein
MNYNILQPMETTKRNEREGILGFGLQKKKKKRCYFTT